MSYVRVCLLMTNIREIILLICVAQFHARELMANRIVDMQDKVGSKIQDRGLRDWLLHHTELDHTMLEKPGHPWITPGSHGISKSSGRVNSFMSVLLPASSLPPSSLAFPYSRLSHLRPKAGFESLQGMIGIHSADPKDRVESIQSMITYQRSGPFFESLLRSDGEARTISPHEARVTVRNARLESTSLDRQGFELRKSPTASPYDAFFDSAHLLHEYIPECIALVKKATGASIVKAVAYNMRSSGSNEGLSIKGSEEFINGPLRFVHGDYAGPDILESGYDLIYVEELEQEKAFDKLTKPPPLLNGEEMRRAKHGRWAAVNVWRNIRPEPVTNFPLAVCDARSVDEDQDLIETDDQYIGKYNPNHRWYYYPQMDRDEVLLFKQWDSRGTLGGDSKAKFVIHSAIPFMEKTVPTRPRFFPWARPQLPVRESIEVRCVAIFDDAE